jgi:hypothetical protein
VQLPSECQTYEAFEAAVLGWVGPEQQQQQQQGVRKLDSSSRVNKALSSARGLQRYVLCRHCHQPGFAYPKNAFQMQLRTVGSAQDTPTTTAAAQVGSVTNAADDVVKVRSPACSRSSCNLDSGASEGCAGAHDTGDTSTDGGAASCCDLKLVYSSSSTSSSTSRLLLGRPKPAAPAAACCAAAECVLAEVQQQVAGGLAALPGGRLTQQQWMLALQGPLSRLPLLGCSAKSR